MARQDYILEENMQLDRKVTAVADLGGQMGATALPSR